MSPLVAGHTRDGTRTHAGRDRQAEREAHRVAAMPQQPSVSGLSLSARQASHAVSDAGIGAVSTQATRPVPPVPGRRAARARRAAGAGTPASRAGASTPVPAAPRCHARARRAGRADPCQPAPAAPVVPAVQVIGIAFAKLSPQTPSDTAIESALVPTVVQVKVAGRRVGRSERADAGVLLVQL